MAGREERSAAEEPRRTGYLAERDQDGVAAGTRPRAERRLRAEAVNIPSMWREDR